LSMWQRYRQQWSLYFYQTRMSVLKLALDLARLYHSLYLLFKELPKLFNLKYHNSKSTRLRTKRKVWVKFSGRKMFLDWSLHPVENLLFKYFKNSNILSLCFRKREQMERVRILLIVAISSGVTNLNMTNRE
jgi:hypothetical protein